MGQAAPPVVSSPQEPIQKKVELPPLLVPIEQERVEKKVELPPPALEVRETIDELVLGFERDNGPITGNVIQCQFRTFAYGITEGADRIPVASATLETQPVVVTFAGLNTKKPFIKGNHGDFPVMKVKDDADELVLLEQNGVGNIFVWTISRSLRRGIYAKSYFGGLENAFGYVATGLCR